MKLNNQHCLLTGASNGIGKAIAHALHKAGATLTLVGRHAATLTALQKELGSQHAILIADITDTAGQQRIIDHVIHHTDINLIIQSAGMASFKEYPHQSAQHIRDTLNTNLLAPMLITQAVLPALSQRELSCIVHIGSVFGSIGFPFYSSYCASKFGLRGFTEALQRELAGSQVRIKYLAPRATATGFNSDAENTMNQALGNRIDKPETVASALIEMLLKDQQRHVIGWPEKLFCRLNGLLPELFDKALLKPRAIAKPFAQQQRAQ